MYEGAIFLVISFFAEIIGTVVGFGSSTTALPLALFIYDFDTALVLVALLHILGNGMRLFFFKNAVDRTLLMRFGLPSVIFTVIGALLIAHLPHDILKGALGVFLIANFILVWTKHLILKPTMLNEVVGGALSGFFAGLLGMGGAMKGVFLDAYNLSKEKYIATAAAIGVVVDVIRIPIYIEHGFFDAEHYWMIIPLVCVAFVGTYIGAVIVKKTNQKLFHTIVQVALFFVGAKFIFDYISSL